jgi:hypothetical protein
MANDLQSLKSSASGLATSANRNALLNGNMDFMQRYGLAGTATNAQLIAGTGYSLDRWQSAQVGTAAASVSQFLDAPTQAQSGFNSLYSLKVTVTTADAAPASTDLYQIRQIIEGFNYAPLHAQKARLQFWVKASLTGTYSVQLRNAAGNRTYVTTYTINSGATWELKTLDITLDNTGTWAFDNTGGLGVCFTLLAGSAFKTGTLGSWQGVDARAANTQANLFATNGNTFQLAQVALIQGDFTNASLTLPFVRCGTNITDEFSKCQRYFCNSNGSAVSAGSAAGYLVTTYNGGNIQSQTHYFPTTMRVAPTIAVTDDSGNVGKIFAAFANDFTAGSQNQTPPTGVGSYTSGWEFKSGGFTFPNDAHMTDSLSHNVRLGVFRHAWTAEAEI